MPVRIEPATPQTRNPRQNVRPDLFLFLIFYVQVSGADKFCLI